MLAAKRKILSGGSTIAKTPLLIPSFSSKGYPNLIDLILTAERFVSEVTLISAYDIFYHRIEPPITFADLIFLDSGGYEAGKDNEHSDLGYQSEDPKPWTEDYYRLVLERWPFNVPTVAVSFDHPDVRLPTVRQVDRAIHFFLNRKNLAACLLVKPEHYGEFVNIDALLAMGTRLAHFQIIGVTERELGSTVLDRMIAIAKLREGLTEHGLNLPIHIFGSLDPINTPHYFCAGADVFDGLGWLRFAYSDGNADYWQMWGTSELGVQVDAEEIRAELMVRNCYFLQDLERQMRDYVQTGKLSAFTFHSKRLMESIQLLEDSLKKGNQYGRK